MKNVCCDKVEQKASRGDTEVGGLWEPYKLEEGVYLMRSFIFSQCRDFRTGVMWEDFGEQERAGCSGFFFIWDCGRL